MKISSTARRLKPSATLAINEQIINKRKNGVEVLHMGFGESPFPVHPIIREALNKNSDKKSYLPTQGILEVREQISEFYTKVFNLKYSPNQIMIGPGSKILIFDALMALDGPLILPAPSWVSYQHQARFSGKQIFNVKTQPENSYRLSPDELARTLKHHLPDQNQQKIMIINYPCNPTGHSFSASQLKELASISRNNNIIIIADEIYALISFEGQEHHSIAEYYPEGTLITGGLSKDRSLGGYRFGVMLLPANETELLRSLISIGSETWSCVSTPIQYAAIEAYKPSRELINYIKECRIIHQIVTSYVHEKIIEMGVRCPAPQGAFYLFPDWNRFQDILEKKGITSSIKLSEFLLKNWNVATLPGFEFGMPENDLCLRIATVDYDGNSALKEFQKDPEKALNEPNPFVLSIAPRVVRACQQLKKFTDSLKM